MRSRLRRAVAISVLTVQAVALFAPSTPQVDTGGLALDKVAHLVLFAAATATVIWAGTPVWPTAVFMICYAFASEVIQGSLYYQRSGDVGDALADIIGVAIGSVLGALWTRNAREVPD